LRRLPLKIACDRNDRTAALADGTIKPDGIALEMVHMGPGELFARMARDREFPVAEFSASTYLNLRARDDDGLIAIPIFLSRMFRHAFIFVNRDAGIERPEDLRGKRVGTMQYQLTSNLWVRGFLKDDHALLPRDMTWVFGGQDAPGSRERAPVAIPADVQTEQAPDGSTLGRLLADGDIDALFAPHVPDVFDDGDRRVRRLYRDYRSAETAYYRRTGYFPIMHLIVIRRDVYEAEPWVATSLFRAFCEAKAAAYQRIRFSGTSSAMVPWLAGEFEEARALFGAPYWPYGVARNRAELETMNRYAYEQGIAIRELSVDELFAPETLDLVDGGS
jgi:4,5-dihydroxyphthalate decarboxylase